MKNTISFIRQKIKKKRIAKKTYVLTVELDKGGAVNLEESAIGWALGSAD